MHVQAQFPCHVQLFVISWAVALQAPLSMEFSRQEWVAISYSSDIYIYIYIYICKIGCATQASTTILNELKHLFEFGHV